MDKRTVDTSSIQATAKKFHTASNDFDRAVSELTSVISSYRDANSNEAAFSVDAEWSNAQKNMQAVKDYLEKFGAGLDKQASSMNDAFQSMKWK